MPGLVYSLDDSNGHANFTNRGVGYTETTGVKLRELRQHGREMSLRMRNTRDRHTYRRIIEENESMYWDHKTGAPLAEVNSLSRNMSFKVQVVNSNVTQDLTVPTVEWRRRINTVQGTRGRNSGISRKNASMTYELPQRGLHKNLAAAVPKSRGTKMSQPTSYSSEQSLQDNMVKPLVIPNRQLSLRIASPASTSSKHSSPTRYWAPSAIKLEPPMLQTIHNMAVPPPSPADTIPSLTTRPSVSSLASFGSSPASILDLQSVLEDWPIMEPQPQHHRHGRRHHADVDTRKEEDGVIHVKLLTTAAEIASTYDDNEAARKTSNEDDDLSPSCVGMVPIILDAPRLPLGRGGNGFGEIRASSRSGDRGGAVRPLRDGSTSVGATIPASSTSGVGRTMTTRAPPSQKTVGTYVTVPSSVVRSRSIGSSSRRRAKPAQSTAQSTPSAMTTMVMTTTVPTVTYSTMPTVRSLPPIESLAVISPFATQPKANRPRPAVNTNKPLPLDPRQLGVLPDEVPDFHCNATKALEAPMAGSKKRRQYRMEGKSSSQGSVTLSGVETVKRMEKDVRKRRSILGFLSKRSMIKVK